MRSCQEAFSGGAVRMTNGSEARSRPVATAPILGAKSVEEESPCSARGQRYGGNRRHQKSTTGSGQLTVSSGEAGLLCVLQAKGMSEKKVGAVPMLASHEILGFKITPAT